jgi:hypothetical protein
METKLTEQESLAIINEMIDQARNNVQKGSANSMIYNGYAVAIVAVLNFILLQILPDANKVLASWIWILMIPSILVDQYIIKRVNRSLMVKTQIDGIISTIWKGFSISVAILLILLFSMSFAFETWHYFALITPTIMIMIALAQFGMAKACRFKPFFWGAIGFWTGSLVCVFFTYFVLKRGDIQFLILALCMISGFVIPGNQLNKKAKENVQGT